MLFVSIHIVFVCLKVPNAFRLVVVPLAHPHIVTCSFVSGHIPYPPDPGPVLPLVNFTPTPFSTVHRGSFGCGVVLDV